MALYGCNALCDVQTWKERERPSDILPLSKRGTVLRPFSQEDDCENGESR